jgi:pimeloyl-ACP methyl ester carboxylesterase
LLTPKRCAQAVLRFKGSFDLDTAARNLQLSDAGEPFDVAMLEPENARSVVLFAVGAGGDPMRHLPLLQSVAGRGCVILAPAFTRLTSPTPTGAELEIRARRLELAVESFGKTSLPLAGVGHSIGAALLLVLAGAHARTLGGDHVQASKATTFEKLGLMAPPTQFFGAPGALSDVHAQISVWVGARDEITPPPQSLFLQNALESVAQVQVHVVPEAGHFSFMDAPPHVTEPHPDRASFLQDIAEQLGDFIAT